MIEIIIPNIAYTNLVRSLFNSEYWLGTLTNRGDILFSPVVDCEHACTELNCACVCVRACVLVFARVRVRERDRVLMYICAMYFHTHVYMCITVCMCMYINLYTYKI